MAQQIFIRNQGIVSSKHKRGRFEVVPDNNNNKTSPATEWSPSFSREKAIVACNIACIELFLMTATEDTGMNIFTFKYSKILNKIQMWIKYNRRLTKCLHIGILFCKSTNNVR